MARPVVAITDCPFPNLTQIERVLDEIGVEVRLAARPLQAEIIAVARAADAVMVTYAPISADTIAQLGRCRIIARLGIGLDNVDLGAATHSGIVVTNVPDYCIDEVSDHALALLLALARRVPQGNALVHGGGWAARDLGQMHRLRGRTLGLVGFGRIARALAGKAQPLGLEVVTCDPYLSVGTAEVLGVQPHGLSELLAISDFVSIHAPLTPETHHLFNAETFRAMKPGAALINTARGALVDECALADALASGALAGAALDVLEHEPPAAESPLLRASNLILTPHTAYSSEESTAELQRKAAEDVVRVLKGDVPRYLANPDVLHSENIRMGGINDGGTSLEERSVVHESVEFRG